MGGQEQGKGALTGVLGIFCVVGAGVTFTTNDMAVKWLSGDYPLHQIILARSLIALLLTLAILVPLEGGYRTLLSPRWRIHLVRGCAIVIANMTFFLALASLPLGEVTALFFIAPLLITALSALLLSEKVGARRWAAVSIGLVGVLIMMQPGSATFQWAALLPLVAGLCYALVQIMTRALGGTESAATLAVYIQVCFFAASGAFGLIAGAGTFASPDAGPQMDFLFRAWIWPSLSDAGVMLGLGVLNATGVYLISQGYRLSEAGLAAPFEYTALPLAIFWGILVWGDWPTLADWVGIALICGAGLYVLYRELALGSATAPRGPRIRP